MRSYAFSDATMIYMVQSSKQMDPVEYFTKVDPPSSPPTSCDTSGYIRNINYILIKIICTFEGISATAAKFG